MIEVYLFRPDKPTYALAVEDSASLSAYDGGTESLEWELVVDTDVIEDEFFVDVKVNVQNTSYNTDHYILFTSGNHQGLWYQISSISGGGSRVNLAGSPDLHDTVERDGVKDGDTFDIYFSDINPSHVTYIPLDFEEIDGSEGHDIKIKRGAGQLALVIALRKEKPSTKVLNNLFIGRGKSLATKNYLRTLNYAKLEWAKITGKLSKLYFRDTVLEKEWNGWDAYKYGLGFTTFRCIIIDFKPKMDSQNNMFIPSLVVEGAWS